ncbi:MAG: transglutaminase domain-containing protein [Candidatus Glassbacteria bacterium]|nr:transglutaminase domain-containing protein [Candidatus Glassbacteria bacterium]
MLNVVLTVAGESRGERIEIEEPPQLPSTIQLLLNDEQIEAGGRYTTTVFDPSAMKNVPLVIEAAGDTVIRYGGELVEVRRVRQEMSGLEIVSFIDSAGRVIEERSGMGYRLVLEDEETARNGEWNDGTTDIQKLVAVEPDRHLPYARELVTLKVEITGLDGDTLLLNGGPQSYDPPVLVVHGRGPDRSAPAEDILPEVRDAALASSQFVLSEHPRLLELATSVVDLNAPDEDKIRQILDWLEDNIVVKPIFSIPSTLEVMQRRSGDCNEFAVMFASLARAAGIPTRIAMGLVYVDDAFYYHAWCECYLDRWVGVDPVFGQFPADATHLRFIAGTMDRQVEILPLIGKVGVKVIESETGLEDLR